MYEVLVGVFQTSFIPRTRRCFLSQPLGVGFRGLGFREPLLGWQKRLSSAEASNLPRSLHIPGSSRSGIPLGHVLLRLSLT